MGVVHQLRPTAPRKYGFKKARRTIAAEERGQLNLFNASVSGRIVRMPSRLTLFESALLLDERGSDLAAATYQQAIDAGDCVADAFCNLGIIQYHRNDADEALRCFTRSLQIDAHHFESHYNLANLFFDRGDLDAARVQYELAGAIEQTYANLYFNLGLLLAIMEEYKESFAALIRYRALAPDEEGRKADGLLQTLQESLEANGY